MPAQHTKAAKRSTRRPLLLTALLACLVGTVFLRSGTDEPLIGGVAPRTQQQGQAPAAPPAQPHPQVAQGPVEEPAPEVPAQQEDVDASTPHAPRPNASVGHQQGLHLRDDTGLHLRSSAVLVVDKGNGEVLARKNDTAKLPMASLTKLMTALVVLEAKLPLEEAITITEDDVDHQRNSRSRLRVGTTLTRAEALHLALMSSENRAAHALGRTYPAGLTAFVAAMNAKARTLGMKDTVYVDPTGLSENNVSTARDLAVLAGTASREPTLREYSVTPERHVQLGGRTLRYLNSNRLVKKPEWDIELQKTGYIIEAGQCVAMEAKIANRDLVIVLLDADSKASRSADAERIKRWVEEKSGFHVARAPAPKPAAKRVVAQKDKDAKDGKDGRKAPKKMLAQKADKPEKGDRGDKADKAGKQPQRVKKTFADGKKETREASGRKTSKEG